MNLIMTWALAQLRYVRCETPRPLHRNEDDDENNEDSQVSTVAENPQHPGPVEEMFPATTAPFGDQHHGAQPYLPTTLMYPSWDVPTVDPGALPATSYDSDYQVLRNMFQTPHSFCYDDNDSLVAYDGTGSLGQTGTLPNTAGSFSIGLQIADSLHRKISENSDTMDETLPELERQLAGYLFLFSQSSRIYSRQALQYCYHRSFDDAHGEYLPLFCRALNNHFMENWPLDQPRRAAFTVEIYWYHDRLSLEETVSLAEGIAVHLPNQPWWEDCDDWLDLASIFHSRGLYSLAEPYVHRVLNAAKNQLAINPLTFFRASPHCTSDVFKAIFTHAHGNRTTPNLPPGPSFPPTPQFLQELHAFRLALYTHVQPTDFDYFQMKCWVSLAAAFCVWTRSPDVAMDMFRSLQLAKRFYTPAGPNGTEFFGLYTVFEELWSSLLGNEILPDNNHRSMRRSPGEAGGRGRGRGMSANQGWGAEAKEVITTVVMAFERWLPEDNWSVREARRVLQETFGGSEHETQGTGSPANVGDAAWHAAANWVDWEANVSGWSGSQGR